jgi:ribosomal 50S subunit-recycling heat shock protein
MRLDLFLKVSRLLPRRSLAQEFCEKNLIRVNGLPAKSSKAMTVGDEIEIKRKDKIVVIKIDVIPTTKQMSKESALELYSVVSERPRENQAF